MIKPIHHHLLTILALSLLLLPSCISKKKYLEEITGLQQNYETQIAGLDSNVLILSETNEGLRLDLAEKRGANGALLATQDKLQDRIDKLQAEIEQLEETAANKEQSLDVTIEQKNQEIAQKQKQLEDILALMDNREAQLDEVFELLSDSLVGVDSLQYMISRKKGAISIELTEELTLPVEVLPG